MGFTMPPVVVTDVTYRTLVRGMSRSQIDALAHLVAFGNIGPTDSRTIDALEKRDLIVAVKGNYHPTELGKLLLMYIAEKQPVAASNGWQGKSNT